MRMLARTALLPAYLVLAILLGGASGGGYAANLILQLMGVAIIVWALDSDRQRGMPQHGRVLWWIACFGLVIVALQLIPIPLELWKALPQRGGILRSALAAGIEPGPVFLSLLPHQTLRSVVWLLPAAAVFIALLRTSSGAVRPLAWAIQIGVVLSVLAGALQLAGGPHSAWYFYAFTNRGSTVGFFANANHLTTLLAVALPFLAALARTATHSPRRPVILGLVGGSLAVILVGIFVNGSLFGYGIALPVLAGSALILVPQTSIRRLSGAFLLPIVLIGLGIVLTTQEGQQMLADSSTLSATGREAIFSRTWTAIGDFMPVGSGIGSFAEIYRLYEDPAVVGRVYINHAHNDYLELILETGIPGGLLIAAFLGWWIVLAVRIWHARHFDAFAAAAVVASGVILAHSLVDYPLRTAAISSIFAMCCALMACWTGTNVRDSASSPPKTAKRRDMARQERGPAA